MIAVSALWLGELAAQDVPVPIRLQYPILLKTLTFDRNLNARSGENLVLGVLYQSTFRQSLDVKDELLAAAKELPTRSVAGLSIRLVEIDLAKTDDLEREISETGVNTMYVTPLRSVAMKTITAATRNKKVLTLTGVPQYVEAGLSIGVGIRGDRPSLIINLKASRAEGADLDSQLLELARTIR